MSDTPDILHHFKDKPHLIKKSYAGFSQLHEAVILTQP